MSSVRLDLFELSPVVDDQGTTSDGVPLCNDLLSEYMIGKPICFKRLTGEKAANVLLDASEIFFDVPTELTTDRDPKFLSAWCSINFAGRHPMWHLSKPTGTRRTAGRSSQRSGDEHSPQDAGVDR